VHQVGVASGGSAKAASAARAIDTAAGYVHRRRHRSLQAPARTGLRSRQQPIRRRRSHALPVQNPALSARGARPPNQLQELIVERV
jgi:hypothetical protein